MSILKDLANRAVTVPITDANGAETGAEVSLRLPLHHERNAILKRVQGMSKGKDEPITRDDINEYETASVDALIATVVDPDDMEREDWERLILASNMPELIDEHQWVPRVVSEALRLCGLNVQIREGVEDHVGEVDAAIGDVPT